MSALDIFFSQKLDSRKREGTLRLLKTSDALVDFCSNDYLGLARSTELYNLIDTKLKALPVQNGSTGSRLLSGNSKLVESVEEKLAKVFQTEAALILNSGYSANIAVLSSIPQKNDTIIYDELSHASIKDGARLSLANRYAFKHNDISDLENKIKKSTGKIFIVAESIYSMDGDQCPLKALTEIAKKYDAFTIVDEAHSTGIYGPAGSGLSVALNLHHQIDLRIHTFGKAMGVHGACVVGSEKMKQFLINFSRPFIYTTSLPVHGIVAIQSAFELLSSKNNASNILQIKIQLYQTKMKSFTNRTLSSSAIQTLILPGNENVRAASETLIKFGFDVRPIMSPTVQKEKERLRICLHSFNSDAEITRLCEVLQNIADNS
jgi:8-amino-7-oxononanoate synthase